METVSCPFTGFSSYKKKKVQGFLSCVVVPEKVNYFHTMFSL